jgi:hypothetical protein
MAMHMWLHSHMQVDMYDSPTERRKTERRMTKQRMTQH